MEVDKAKLAPLGSENAEHNSKPIAPVNTIDGKPIVDFTKVSVLVAAKAINIYYRSNLLAWLRSNY